MKGVLRTLIWFKASRSSPPFTAILCLEFLVTVLFWQLGPDGFTRGKGSNMLPLMGKSLFHLVK